MKTLFILIISLVLMPSLASAQKAYESVAYHSKLNNRVFVLKLGMGYFAASTIKRQTGSAKPVVFDSDTGVPDEKNQLTFHAKHQPDYFILYDMKESYDDVPDIITGRYWTGKKWSDIKFTR